MSSPERMNVLLSRARNGLIMIGNSHTFTRSRKGGDIWTKLINMIRQGGHVYGGFPIVCQRHPHKKSILKTPGDFDKESPDGGCLEPWQVFKRTRLSKDNDSSSQRRNTQLQDSSMSLQMSPDIGPFKDAVFTHRKIQLSQGASSAMEMPQWTARVVSRLQPRTSRLPESKGGRIQETRAAGCRAVSSSAGNG